MSDSLTRIRNLSPKRLMLLALDQQSKLEELELPVVEVNDGCKFVANQRGHQQRTSR